MQLVPVTAIYQNIKIVEAWELAKTIIMLQ